MRNWELKLVRAHSILIENLSKKIFSQVMNLESGYLKFVFNDGSMLFVTYNKVGEYSYQYIISHKKNDRVRFDNYDKHWKVKTSPHHFHPCNEKVGLESPMNGIPDNDMPILINYLKENVVF